MDSIRVCNQVSETGCRVTHCDRVPGYEIQLGSQEIQSNQVSPIAIGYKRMATSECLQPIDYTRMVTSEWLQANGYN